MAENKKVLVTEEGFAELKRRLEELREKKKINEIAVKDARDQGDLSENADYEAARDEQAKIAAEIMAVENAIENAEIIRIGDDNNFLHKITVRFDASNVEDDENEIETYVLVGSTESDPLNGRISNESPLGKKLLYAKVGDKVLVRTEDGFEFYVEVLNIEK